MRCDDLERWLDLGLPASQSEAAVAHTRACRRCASALAAAQELETLLAGDVSMVAPPEFTHRVMARVAAAREARAHAPVPAGPSLAWWVRAAGEPATALALFLAGLLLWKGEIIQRSVAGLLLQLGPAIAHVQLTPRLGATLGRPEALLGLALALMPMAGWVSWTMYRWAERLARIPTAR